MGRTNSGGAGGRNSAGTSTDKGSHRVLSLKRKIMPCVVVAALGAAVSVAPGVAHADTQPSHFTWTVTSASLDGIESDINNGATNGNPNAILFVTPNLSAGGVCGCVNDTAPIGVYYDTNENEWSIFDEDGSAVPVGAEFNVVAFPAATSSVFTLTASSSNISGDTAFIDDSAINGTTNQILQATQVTEGALNDYNAGVWYDPGEGAGEYGVFNEGGSPMVSGTEYNVLVGAQAGGKASFLKAVASNTGGNSTHFSSTTTNGDSNAFMLATPNWDPNDVCGCKYTSSATGVWYIGSYAQEVVFNENNHNMAKKTDFNVLYWNS